MASVVRVSTVLIRTKVRLPFHFGIGIGSLNRSRYRLRSRNWSRSRNWLPFDRKRRLWLWNGIGTRIDFRSRIPSRSQKRIGAVVAIGFFASCDASVADWGSESASAPFLGEASASASALESEADRLSDAESDIVFKSESESVSGCGWSSSAELRLWHRIRNTWSRNRSQKRNRGRGRDRCWDQRRS